MPEAHNEKEIVHIKKTLLHSGLCLQMLNDHVPSLQYAADLCASFDYVHKCKITTHIPCMLLFLARLRFLE